MWWEGWRMLCDLAGVGFAPEGGRKAATGSKRRLKMLLKAALWAAGLLVLALALSAVFGGGVAYADDGATAEEIEKELADGVDSAIERLDLDLFRDFLESLGDDEREALGGDGLDAMLKAFTEGSAGDFFGRFTAAAGDMLADSLLGFLPSFVTVIVVCLLKSMLTGLTSGFPNRSTDNVVHIVCYSVVVVVLLTGAVKIIGTVTETVEALSSFSEAVFPVLLTLLAAVGGTSGAAVYQPFMGVLSGTVIAVIGTVIVPAFVATIVFSVVGNISENVRLSKLSKLFKSGAGWFIGIVFGLYGAFLTAQGITGGVIDRLSFNAAKFAVSSYVPILGGYLSDGFDLLTASLVLVKNAVGATGVVVLLAVVLYPLLQVAVFTLGLRLTAAVTEPLGDKRVSGMTASLADSMSLLVTALAGVGFMFFVLLMLIIGSFNPGV